MASNYCAGKKTGEMETFHSFDIINISTHRRLITKPHIGLYNSNDNKKFLQVIKFDEVEIFPIPLEVGDVFVYKFPADAIEPDMKKRQAKKFRLLVFDTTGKKYKSKWISLA